METNTNSDNNNARPPPSPGSTDTEEYETWTVVGSGRKLKENLTQNSPKITISKDSGEESDHHSKDDEENECQECSKNEKLLKTPTRKQRHNSESRVEDIEGHDADGEISDGISVISESDLDHHDTGTDRIEEQKRHFNLHEKLAESLKQRKFDSDDDVVPPPSPPKKFVSVVRAGPTELATVPNAESQSIIRKITDTISGNKAAASVAVFAILIAGAVGFFSHVGVMVRNYQAQSDDVTKFLIYQKKIDDLQLENVELKNRLTNFESRLDLIKPDRKFADEGRKFDTRQPPSYPPSGSGRGKKIKTRFDHLKKPPVAAGGDEDPVVTIHVSSMDETETWSESDVPPLQDESKNLDIDLDIEAIDPTNFEPILNLDIIENKTVLTPPSVEPNPDFGQPFTEPTIENTEKVMNKNNFNQDMKQNKNEFEKERNQHEKTYKEKRGKSEGKENKNKHERGERSDSEERYQKQKKNRSAERDTDRKEHRREKSQQREGSQERKRSDERERHQDRDRSHKRERSQERESSQERNRSQKREGSQERNGKKNHDRKWERDDSHEREFNHNSKYNKDRHYDDSREDRFDDHDHHKHDKHDKYDRREKSSDREYNKQRGESYKKHQNKDEWKKREKSFDASGHKPKYPREDKDWYKDRFENRENNRKNLNDDWFSERSLDRELLRARAEGSAERIH